MYTEQTYETILSRMLARVPATIDKREGSIIYDALAPAAAELAQMYIELDINSNLSYADTASGEYLARRTAERGIVRRPATKALRKGVFTGADSAPFNPPIGSRFTSESLYYVVKEVIGAGQCQLECETAGQMGNEHFGTLLPVTYIAGLSTAELTDILIPGEAEETDELLRQRYFQSLESQAYGGNIADYQEKTNALTGVGGTKVFPAWNGGGTVKLVIIASDFSKPSTTLIGEVQSAIDPQSNQGEGVGLAPIGHIVTVESVAEVSTDIETQISFQNDYGWQDVQSAVKNVIGEYLQELRSQWASNTSLIVRISQIETRVLNVPGVLDIQNTKINGTAQNFALADTEIPVLGEVIAV